MRILIDGQTFETEELNRGIGIYMRNTLTCMLKADYSHEWFLCVSNDRHLSVLEPWVQNKLHVIVSPAFAPGTDHSRASQYTKAIQETVDRYQIDLFWVPNPLMVNVLFISHALTCEMIVTIHDLIPLVFPIKEWPESILHEYHRRLDMINNETGISILSDSDATKNDWSRLMSDKKNQIRVVPLAADSRKFFIRRKKTERPDPYILFTGGFDYRKNVDGAIEAFRHARELHQDDREFLRYKMYIVGNCSGQVKTHYEQIIAGKGLTGLVILTGFVSEEELIRLYHEADLFFFPSKYEGFGLPLLEAMLSGCYIVSADNSSLPEVCGDFAAYFSVDKPDQMAEALYRGYCSHQQEKEQDILNRQKHALDFSWYKTALQTLRFMEETAIPPVSGPVKPTLAILTPWPDQKTGIGDYEFTLIPYLTEYFHISVFTTAPETERRNLDNISVFSMDEYRKKRKKFDYHLFQIGNNSLFHKEIMDLFMRTGGIAEIHDFALTNFFYYSYYLNDEKKQYKKLLITAYGRKTGKIIYADTVQKRQPPDILEYPMSEAVEKLSSKTILHNHWSAGKLPPEKTGVIPLASFPVVPAHDTTSHDERLHMVRRWKEQGESIIGCAGWVNSNKLPETLIQALRILRDRNIRAKLVFWGENKVETLDETIISSGLTDHVFVSGYMERAQYLQAVAMTDIVVNLRYPSMGESSATLCEAFQMSKAVIVSDLNQYREFPDDVCWKLPQGDRQSEILAAYIDHLIIHPEVRKTLGNNAKVYTDYNFAPERIARQYYDFITRKGKK